MPSGELATWVRCVRSGWYEFARLQHARERGRRRTAAARRAQVALEEDPLAQAGVGDLEPLAAAASIAAAITNAPARISPARPGLIPWMPRARRPSAASRRSAPRARRARSCTPARRSGQPAAAASRRPRGCARCRRCRPSAAAALAGSHSALESSSATCALQRLAAACAGAGRRGSARSCAPCRAARSRSRRPALAHVHELHAAAAEVEHRAVVAASSS